MTPYSRFVARHEHLSREDFLARVTVPHLLIDTPKPAKASTGFRTVKFTKEALAETEETGHASLLPVTKRQGVNAFGMMITMGRASNNDLVIPDPRISKFHAYFRQVGGEWRINDANSRNGTFVDGISVPQDEGMTITSGARIKLAKTLELVFYDPPGLYEKIQADRARGGG